MSSTESSKCLVNAWTQWGDLETVVVGRADHSCYPPKGPHWHPKIHDPQLAELMCYPSGPRHPSVIAAANRELDNLADVLAAECVTVERKTARTEQLKRDMDKMVTTIGQSKGDKVVRKDKVKVLRGEPFEQDITIRTPVFETHGLYPAVCPRDVHLTIGNTIYEAPMAQRSRVYEFMSYRKIMYDLFDADVNWKWRPAPRPSMAESMFDLNYAKMTDEQQRAKRHEFSQDLLNTEIAFDAAVTARCGKDVFFLESSMANRKAYDWMKRDLNGTVRLHSMHLPDYPKSTHMDIALQPLRPPRGEGSEGICLYNPSWPPLKAEAKLWTDNNWRMVPCANPVTDEVPLFSQCSRWLAINFVQVNEKVIVIEENERGVYNLLTELGFDPITVPMRNVYEFGGGIHCSTWDIRRNDGPVDYFPDQTNAVDIQNMDYNAKIDTIAPAEISKIR